MKIINIKKIAATIQKQRHNVLVKLRRLKREDPFTTEDRSIIVDSVTHSSYLFYT